MTTILAVVWTSTARAQLEPPGAESLRDDSVAQVLVAESGGLTAQEVAIRARRSSGSVRARLDELDAARARLDQTIAQFFPRLQLRAAYTRLSHVSTSLGPLAIAGAQSEGPLLVGTCPGDTPCVVDSQGRPAGARRFDLESIDDVYTLSATLGVPISDYVLRLSDSVASASASRAAASAQAEAAALKAMSDARTLFWDWLRARARAAIAAASLQRTAARVKDGRVLMEVGTITLADMKRLEALQANIEQVLLEAETYRDLTERQLAIAMGDPLPAHYRVGEDVHVEAPALTGDVESLTRAALSRRHELVAMAEATRAAELGAKSTRVGAYPRLDAFGDVTYANPNARYFPPLAEFRGTWSVGVAATWVVGDAFVNGAAARSLEATSRSLASQRRALEDSIRQEVASSYLAREKSKGARVAAERGLAAATEAYRAAVELNRTDRATTTEVIAAESDLLSASLSEINARIEARIAEERLRHATAADAGR